MAAITLPQTNQVMQVNRSTSLTPKWCNVRCTSKSHTVPLELEGAKLPLHKVAV